MKHKLFCLLTLCFTFFCSSLAQTFVNLTPRPKSMTVKTDSLALPASFSISQAGLDGACIQEVERFAKDYAAVTGAEVTVGENQTDALFQVSMLDASSKLKDCGYTLAVSSNQVVIKAKTAVGFFYAFQSVKKMLPANVMAGKKDPAVTAYALPLVTISDEPRFDYRGFMLDVSRHFYTVEEVKRMLDIMAAYKMNAFHWHLTDDQGWRVEIKKYPKLTTVASIAPNSLFTDLYEAKQYWINKPYGPYFYTQDEIREVVAYAKARHIEVIPEIDMPGHSAAAMTAYPEFSCNPSGGHQVWCTGGVSTDVINVANPAAVQFAKDVLAEIMELFPGKQIHIGGDECPTSAWENNAECQALYKKLGMTSYRQLQSHFIKELDEFVKAQGRKLSVWNEAITAEGADLDIMKKTDADVYCWYPANQAVTKASQIGMNSIFTPFGPYYINRKQGNSEQDPPNAGDGSDHVMNTYNLAIPSSVTRGIQGTFWCENVSNAELMEWSALPRLIAIAERGWTPEANKSFTDFQKRMSADTVMLNYGNYKYCKYYMLDGDTPGQTSMVMPHANTAAKKYYYRLISGGTDANRSGRCIELLSKQSPLIATYSSNGAAEGRLWTNAQAAEGEENYDYQWWSIEEDPKNAGRYALVCKALPDGSVNANPTATSVTGRWTYDNTGKHYNFLLGTGAYGTKGNNYFYSLASTQVSGQYLNSSMPKQGLAVNVYGSPNDGCGGQWEFSPMEAYDSASVVQPVTFDYLQDGKTYVFTNAVEGYGATALADNGKGTLLQHSADVFANNAWVVEASKVNEDGSQTMKLKNAATGRYITAVGSYVSREGFPVNVGSSVSTANVTLACQPAYGDLRVKVGGKSLFPLPAGTVNAGSTIQNATNDALRVQGSAWKTVEVRVVKLDCVDEQGTSLGNVSRSLPVSVSAMTADYCPEFKNAEVQSLDSIDTNTFRVVYKRVAYTLTLLSTDTKGAWLGREEVNVPVGESKLIKAPAFKYYTLENSDVAEGTTITPDADRTLTFVYSTDAITGVKSVGEVVTMLEPGKSYLLYDATTAAGRAGYRCIVGDNAVNRVLTAEELSPKGVWTLEGTGNKFKVKNEYSALYVPQLVRSTPTTASKTAAVFTFTFNDDGETWNIKGTNNQYWDGLESGALVGWDGGTGHPIRISTFFAQPLYTVNVVCKDEEDKLLSSSSELIPAGQAYTLAIPSIENYTLSEVTGNENYEGTVEGFVNVVAVFKKNVVDGIDGIEADGAKPQSHIYDLQGRRLQRVSQTGIYIVNGKKVWVK